MTGCSVVGCKNRTEQGYKLFQIPNGQSRRGQERRRLWLEKIGRPDVKPMSSRYRICSQHFDKKDIVVNFRSGRHFLKSTAVPFKLNFDDLYHRKNVNYERTSNTTTYEGGIKIESSGYHMENDNIESDFIIEYLEDESSDSERYDTDQDDKCYQKQLIQIESNNNFKPITYDDSNDIDVKGDDDIESDDYEADDYDDYKDGIPEVNDVFEDEDKKYSSAVTDEVFVYKIMTDASGDVIIVANNTENSQQKQLKLEEKPPMQCQDEFTRDKSLDERIKYLEKKCRWASAKMDKMEYELKKMKRILHSIKRKKNNFNQ